MRPGATDFPTIECSAPEVECHSERRVPLSPSITSMTCLRDFCPRGRASHTTEFEIPPQRLHLQPFKTKVTLKNSGSLSERSD